MSWLGKDNVISSDEWPDWDQERNAFKPHCSDATTRECCGKLSPDVKGCGQDNTMTLRQSEGYTEPALVEGMGGHQGDD
jgi:hypothetical protein